MSMVRSTWEGRGREICDLSGCVVGKLPIYCGSPGVPTTEQCQSLLLHCHMLPCCAERHSISLGTLQ